MGSQRLAAVLAVLLSLTWFVAPPAAAAPAPDRPKGPVVLVGVPGLMWEEADPETMPHLWRLAQDGSIGNLSIRTATSRTCPVDGWLSISAGQRAASERQTYSICELPRRPERDGAGATVPDFAQHVDYNASSKFVAQVGLLGDTVHAAGGSTLAVGPGAALAAADGSGRVDRYLGNVDALRERDWRENQLVVIDLDDLADLYLDLPANPDAELGEDAAVDREEPEPDPIQDADRLERLSAIDDQLGTVLDMLPAGATLMVAGVSVEAGPSNLNVAVLHGVGPGGEDFDRGYLSSESTRRAGLVTLTDITTTLLHAMSLDAPPSMVGRAWKEVRAPADFTEAVNGLVEFNTAAKVVESLIASFFSGLVAIQLLIYAAAAYTLKRYGGRDRKKRDVVLSVIRAVALGGAAFPVSSYLANLIPWWSAAQPQLALLGSVLLADALVVALALAGPWRRDIIGPAAVVAAVTTGVLFVDLCTGAHLQMNSPTGYSPIVAGRFYGLGNIAFATFATGVLMTVAGVARLPLVRGHRRRAVTVALALGVATLFVIGWPGLGTDFGGVIAIIPGLAVTVLMIAGKRVTLPRLLLVGAVSIVVIGAMAYADYLRPPSQRSHFGAFAGQVVDGEAGTVVARKLGAMVGSLGNWQLTLLSACALLFLFAVLNKPTDWRMGALQRAYEYAPTLRAGLTGSLVTALAGFAVNDSGIAIPALALTVAVPLTLSACAWVLRQEGPSRPAGAPGRGGPDGRNGAAAAEVPADAPGAPAAGGRAEPAEPRRR
ncbi:hypothetical protein [Marinactinospora rubrisoli]|uniref:Uncharacterized protein n=1 Tax=Marinactinospora rubrisoli TaxID=2715399 RepID=A0ABW2KB58_9ACTN